MHKSKLIRILNIQATDDMNIILAKARKYAFSIHPDRNPNYLKQWLEFEKAWDILKRIKDSKGNFSQYEFELSKIAGSQKVPIIKKQQKTGAAKDNKPPKNIKPYRGKNITSEIAVDLLKIINGGEIEIEIPDNSILKTKTTNKSYTIKLSSSEAKFNKRGNFKLNENTSLLIPQLITIKDCGEVGGWGGANGDWLILIKPKEDSLKDRLYSPSNDSRIIKLSESAGCIGWLICMIGIFAGFIYLLNKLFYLLYLLNKLFNN